MKNSERFNRAIKALVDAFFNDELRKGDCSACAVGNLVCKRFNDTDKKSWSEVVCTTLNSFEFPSQKIIPSNYRDLPKEVIDSTLYTYRELARIEYSFEKTSKIHWHSYEMYTKKEIMQDQFNGLMAVVEVLCEIEGIDNTDYKKAFEYSQDFKQVNPLVLA